MTVIKSFLTAAAATLAFAAHAAAPEAPQTSGTVVLVQATGEVVRANDQAVVTMAIEEQDKDKALAASRVNQKMRQGMDILRKEDPAASLKTHSYYTYAVYAEERPQPKGQPAQPRVRTGWRVGQSVQITTTSLERLPKTVAAAQSVLTLNNLQFGLSPQTTLRLEEQRIAATYRNLTDRVNFLARAMGRNAADAVVDSIDLDGAGNAMPSPPMYADAPALMLRSAKMSEQAEVAEPSFEPGETTVRMGIVAKLHFK